MQDPNEGVRVPVTRVFGGSILPRQSLAPGQWAAPREASYSEERLHTAKGDYIFGFVPFLFLPAGMLNQGVVKGVKMKRKILSLWAQKTSEFYIGMLFIRAKCAVSS